MQKETLQIKVYEEISISDVVLNIEHQASFTILLFAKPQEQRVKTGKQNLPYKIRPPNSLKDYNDSFQGFESLRSAIMVAH
jgi:hypothetical protein